MSLQNPEVYLSSFNNVLRRLLTSPILLDNTEVLDELKRVYRKTLISEIFFNKYIIAVSGLQGAGKTTLVKEIYDIPDEIIPPNIGEGEKIPILLTETKNDDYEYIKKEFNRTGNNLEILQNSIAQEEFNNEAKNPSKDVIYLELKIPNKFFDTDEISFVLLPGIEDNKDESQEILNHALVSSATCVFLFDQIRYADYRNREALNRIKKDFYNANPIYILSQADKSKDDNKELFDTFRKDFVIKQKDRIIITGLGDYYKTKWLPKLKAALNNHKQIQREFRTRQTENLQEILVNEFGDIISKLETIQHDKDLEENAAARETQRNLEVFESKVKKLRNRLAKKLRDNLIENKSTASKIIDEYLRSRNILNNVRDLFVRDITKNHEFQKIIQDAWEKAYQQKSSPVLRATSEVQLEEELLVKDIQPDSEGYPAKIGEYNNKYFKDNVHWKYLINDLKLLLNGSNNDDWKFSNNLKTNLQTLPVFLLEFSRIANAFPKYFKIDDKRPTIERADVIEGVTNDYASYLKKHSRIITATGMALGLDAAYDGTIDSIPNLFEAASNAITGSAVQAGSLTMTLATGAGATIAGAFIYKSILNQINKADLRDKVAAEKITTELVESYITNVLEKYDDLMNIMYERLLRSFEKRFYLNKTYTQKETLMKMIADSKNLRDELYQQMV